MMRQHRPGILVILVSGCVDPAQRAAALCDGFLDKPYGTTEVHQHIAALIQSGRRAALRAAGCRLI